MADDQSAKPQQPPQSEPQAQKKDDSMDLTHHEAPPMPVVTGMGAPPPARDGLDEKLTATYSGMGGFIRLACYVLVRRVNLARMKATLSRLQKDCEDAHVALGKEAIEKKLSHAEITPLTAQIESLNREIAAQREQVRAVEAEPLSEDPQIKKAEINLRNVKIAKINEAIAAVEAKARPTLVEIARIVRRENLAPQDLQPSCARIQAAEAETAAQERRINETNEEYEVVTPGTRALAYGFWVAVVVVILVLLSLATRGCSSSAKRTAMPPAPALTQPLEKLG